MKTISISLAVFGLSMLGTVHLAVAELNRPIVVTSTPDDYQRRELTKFVKALDREHRFCARRPGRCK